MICPECAKAADTGRQNEHEKCKGCDCMHGESREFLRKLRGAYIATAGDLANYDGWSHISLIVDGVQYEASYDVIRRALYEEGDA